MLASTSAHADARAKVERIVDAVMGYDPRTKWRPFEIASVSVDVAEDGLSSVWIYAWAVPRAQHGIHVFKFLTGRDGNRVSQRFAALLKACARGVQISDADQLTGRHFAARNEGRAPEDFSRLEAAITQQISA